MKLFPKLALTVSGLLVASLLCSSLSFYIAERRSVRVQADEERHALLQNLAHMSQESAFQNDDLMLIKYMELLRQWNPSLLSASVMSPQGKILANSDPDEIGKSALNLHHSNQSSEMLVMTQPVHLGNKWVATASVVFSEKQFEETVQARLRGLRRRLEANVLGALAAGIVISFLLALSWSRPVKSLALAARRVGQGKYDLDLQGTTGRRDELGFLSRCFQSMAQELAQLGQMKDDFVSAVTHELRSPLGAIESYLNVIQEKRRQGIPDSDWNRYLERIHANTRRLNRFVDDLLDVAALERGTVAVEVQPLDIKTLIEDFVAAFSTQFGERNLTCSIALPMDLPKAWADEDKIHHVLVNLLSNAIKFTPKEGKIEIGVQELKAGKELRIYVKDTGVGIAQADQSKIFNKFEQVKATRQAASGPKGTGLGLAICRALIDLHGGTLGVESRPGEGSCFYFTLPMADDGKAPAGITSIKRGALI